MSYDIALYFRHEEFPFEEWQQVLAPFAPQERELKPEWATRHCVVAEWLVRHKDSGLFLKLQDVRSDRFSKPDGTCWNVDIYNTGNHHPHNVWFQFAIPYYALTLIDHVIFSDSQLDVFIDDEQDFLDCASSVLRKFGIGKMFKLGLMDAEGQVIF